MSSTRRAVLRGALSLGAAAAVWTPAMHWLFEPAPSDLLDHGPLSRWGRGLLAAVEERSRTGAHLAAVRRVNPEWDLIERMIAGLALANVALREPRSKRRLLGVLDGLSASAEAAVAANGQGHFLLPYGRRGGWRGGGRSLFVDGELALLHGARRIVADHPAARDAFRRRVDAVAAAMSAGPLHSGESYPDECWTFCNTAGLVALRMAEVLDGADHRELRAAWVRDAKRALIDADTGMIASAYSLSGRVSQPPEGSSLWWCAHALRVVDEPFARSQYALGVRFLAKRLLGFAWAAEWAAATPRQLDIDSGGVVPVLDASPASSGFALLAARSFGDPSLQRQLLASVGLAGFPAFDEGRLRMRTGNPVGDAILLYSLVQGPVWEVLA